MTNLLNAMKNSNFNYFGVRGDNFVQSVGQELDASFDWDYEVDCISDVKLDGTCAVKVGYLYFDGEIEDIETLQNAINFAKENYRYASFCIIGGNTEFDGADQQETIIENAEVIAII